MHRVSMSLVLCTIVLSDLIFHFSAHAQWSSDANVNTQICDVAGEQVLPKIAYAGDGGIYISWFDSRSSGYAVYLQRLDSLGVKQFAAAGLLISAHPQSSSLVDYDLTVDDSSNATIVFTDIRDGGAINPFAYKISPAGAFLWDGDGVTLADTTTVYQPNPKVAATSDGGAVITWIYGSSPNKVAMQKLSPGGAKLWGTRPILLSGFGTEHFTYPSLVRSDNGSVILLWSGYTGTFLNPGNYRLYTQKFSSAGTPVWSANPDTAYGLGRVAGFFVPKIFSDGEDGAFYVWQDDRNAQNMSHSYVQHYSRDGLPQYQVNGAAGSTSTGTNQFDAWVTPMTSTGEAYMVWKESNSLQSQFAVYGQRFSATGAQLWPAGGRGFIPFGNNSTINQLCFTADSGVMMFFNESIFGSANTLVKGFMTDRSGVIGWGGTILTVSSRTSAKSKIVGTIDGNGMTVLVWSDGRNDGGGIYAQNINSDGTLGNPAVGVSGSNGHPGTFELLQNYPNPFNPSTTFSFSVRHSTFIILKVYDVLGREVATLVNEVKQPGEYGVTWDASTMASGVYFYRLQTTGYVQTRKLLLLK